jgi:alkaline phosphatase D
LLGDQVYVDSKAGLFDPLDDHERFVAPHEDWLRQPEVRSVLRRLPAHMMLDDHELEADWEPTALGEADPIFASGLRTFNRYQTIGNAASNGEPGPARPIWYTLDDSDVPFFILDTRCERTPRSGATAARAEILGRQQFVALETWLFKRRDDGRPKFVVSPSVFLPRHSHAVCTGSSASAIRSDGWCGR